MEKLKLTKKKVIISIVVLLLIILLLVMLLNREQVSKVFKKARAEREERLIRIALEIKKEQTNGYNCLITFTSNDENDKIKRIEYPKINDEEEPTVIEVADENGKQQVSIDYSILKEDEDKRFKVTTVSGRIEEKSTVYTLTYNNNGDDVDFEEKTITTLLSKNIPLDNTPTREGYLFSGWSEYSDQKVAELYDEYNYKQDDEKVNIYATWRKIEENRTYESLLKAVEQMNESCQIGIGIYGKNEVYDTDYIVHNGDLVLDGTTSIREGILTGNTYEVGDDRYDVATGTNDMAKNTVILKVNGNLTINEGVTLTTCKNNSGYGGPKGLLVYCTGTLTNNGTISMTARGAYAQGQDVWLWKNTDGSYEYIPAEGAPMASKEWAINSDRQGAAVGENGKNRQTGGGSTGSRYHLAVPGAGGPGTSYSGGPGGGGADKNWFRSNPYAGDGSSNGGAGGYGRQDGDVWGGGGGAGNPGGSPSGGAQRGQNGTGGLLVIYARKFENNNLLEAQGANGGAGSQSGGASGGGSINIFTIDYNENYGTINTKGGTYITNGGTGAISVGQIINNSYVNNYCNYDTD